MTKPIKDNANLDPKDLLANRLIHVRSQITASQNTTEETHALTDVFQGMTDLAVLALPETSKRRSEQSIRKNVANRIALIIDGLKRYSNFQVHRIETFAYWVDIVGGDVKSEYDDIGIMKEKTASKIKELDDIIANLRSSNPGRQVVEAARRKISQTYPAIQEQSTIIRDIDKRLREKGEHIISTSLHNKENELVRRIIRGIGLPSQDDPGSVNPI